jgi:ABC-type transport system substrate-binding protein
MRTDRPPFNDVRVRQAMSLAIDRKGIVEATMEGGGVWNGPVPAAFKDWTLPVDKLGDGARWYQYNPAEAKQMLAAAGHSNGTLSVTMQRGAPPSSGSRCRTSGWPRSSSFSPRSGGAGDPSRHTWTSRAIPSPT